MICTRFKHIRDHYMEERNQAVSERKGLRSDEVRLSLWGKFTGYSKRALVETGF